MSESRQFPSPSQRRIRHIRSIAGRNIVWYGESHDADVAMALYESGNVNTDTIAGSHGSNEPESTLTSRQSSAASSPGQGNMLQVVQQATKSLSLSGTANRHQRTGSSPVDLANDIAYSSPGMRRSESASSMKSSTSTTVEDSSLTKSAYKLPRSKRPHWAKQSTTGLQLHRSQARQETEHSAFCVEDRGLLDCYLTLHFSPADKPFFTTEIIPNTVNPTFQTIDTSQWNWYDAAKTELTARLWARHSFPESASMAKGKPGDNPHHHQELAFSQASEPSLGAQDFQLLIEWTVDLNALTFLGRTLHDPPHTFPENTLVFELLDGYYTAPEIASNLWTLSKRSSLVEPLADNDDDASIRTEHSQKTKRSYTYHHIVKLNTLKECIFDTEKSAEQVRLNISQLLEMEQSRFRLQREQSQRLRHLDQVEAELAEKNNQLRKQRQNIADLRHKIETRRAALKAGTERFEAGMRDLEENEAVLERNTQMHIQLFHKLTSRKKELIADLFTVFPIEQSFHDVHQFCIRGLYLPNSVYTGCDEDTIATALGFTAHLVTMLAFYLGIPLRYPITPMGSRATIRDPVSLITGSKDFPLYAKGVDKYRFEFGVFLLNKNIEQLMNAYGLIVMDLRHTLPNIHYFIQAVLTTSVASVPTSISVLSISSYANQASNEGCRNQKVRSRFRLSAKSRPYPTAPEGHDTPDASPPSPKLINDHQSSNHLTLQPILNHNSSSCSSSPPSPSTSVTSLQLIHSHMNPVSTSPKIYATGHSHSGVTILSASQATTGPPLLEPVTTSSTCSPANHPYVSPKQIQ